MYADRVHINYGVFYMKNEDKFKKVVIEAIGKTINQGRKSMDTRDSNCRYRGCDGDRCTIGHMIKDEYYDEHLEGKTAASTLVSSAIESSNGIDLSYSSWDDIQLLDNLQSAHDGNVGLDFVKSYVEALYYLVSSGRLPDWVLEAVPKHLVLSE